MPEARVTLVTGYPSFRARQLVNHLLAHTAEEVWLVVAERDRESAGRHAGRLSPEHADRVRWFWGEPAAIDFGLSGAEYRELCEAVTCIQHLGQAVGPTFGRLPFEEINVCGMREALELAHAASRLRSMVVHSGLAVSGDRQGRVLESELVAGQGFDGPGPATLARAELMAERRKGQLPIVIVRSGQVIGPGDTLAADGLDGVHLLLALILNAPQDLPALLPDWGEVPLNVVPVEVFVRAAHALSEHPGARGRTLQLTDPRPLTVRRAFLGCIEVRARLAQEGLALPPPSAALRRDGVLRESLQGILRSPRSFINATFRKVRYDTTVAERLLGEVGLACPSLESRFEEVVRYVAHVLASAGIPAGASS